MGAIYEYFRTADAATVAQLMEATDGGPLVVWGEEPVFDAVEAPRVDPMVVLGQLVSIAVGVPWSTDLVGEELVWPTVEDPDGPWVTALADRTRDALADIADARYPEVATRWSDIEELAGFGSSPDMLPIMTELVGLARRAREDGQSLFCWMCL